MQNNNLTNINMNKVLQDKLSTQMSTEKKISKPSEVNKYKNKIRLLISRDHSPIFQQHLGILDLS